MAVNGAWPAWLDRGLSRHRRLSHQLLRRHPALCPESYQNLASQEGNFPVFEGTSLYSLRLDQNIGTNHRLTFRVNVSPSTVTGIEVSGQDQPFGQNAYSRTSQQTYRDVAGVFQDTWTIGNNKVNEFRFQYARRGLSYFYNTQIPGGSDPAVNIPGFAYFGREPYSYIQRVEQRYQFTDNFSWTIGRHNTKFGADVNYLPLTAIFTVNYGGVYDFGSFSSSALGFTSPIPGTPFPDLSPVQAYGAGLPGDFIQGLGSPSDSFKNIPIGAFWQDSWRISPNVTLNYGVRYDVEIPPKFKAPQGLALPAYNLLGLQKGIQTDKNNIQPRIGLAWDPQGTARRWCAPPTACSMTIPLLGLYFLGDASDGSSSGQLGFRRHVGLCSGTGQPQQSECDPYFSRHAGATCLRAFSPFPLAASNMGYLPNQQQFQSLNFPQSVFLNQNYLNFNASNPANPRSCRSPSSPSAILSRRISFTPIRSRRTLASSAISAADSLSAWPTTSTADAT